MPSTMHRRELRRRPSGRASRIAVVCVSLAGGLSWSCTDGPDREKPRPPVVLIGIDGMEWSVLGPMLAAGELPRLRGLVEDGVSGRLYTLSPTLSPAIWTSVATGKRPEDHGIQHFLDKNESPYTSRQRRSRALWNIASLFGKEVLCVGWWVTWPAEEIDGRMVAPVSAAGQDQAAWKGNLHPPDELDDQTWPRELIDEIYPLVESLGEPESIARRRAELFGDDLGSLEKLEHELITQTMWSDLADEGFVRSAVHLLGDGSSPPDLTMLYLGAPDVASHRFWAYRHPDEFSFDLPDRSRGILEPTIARFYREADRRVGEVLDALPDDVDVVICSDHGFHAYFTERPSPLGITGHHYDGPSGVAILSGPSFRDGVGAGVLRGEEPIDLGRIYEVMPTILYLLGIPSALDLMAPDGGALLRMSVGAQRLATSPPADPIASHDDGFVVADERSPPPAATVDAMREWMGQLGYMEGVGEDALFVEVLPDR